MKKAKASELDFISVIKRDGSGTNMLTEERKKEITESHLTGDFRLQCLSITEGTYIAFNFNAYVVKYKKNEK
jgi:hypothetical protein